MPKSGLRQFKQLNTYENYTSVDDPEFAAKVAAEPITLPEDYRMGGRVRMI